MLCNFACAFPDFIGNLLDREHGLRRRFREETVSDLWVASLVPMRGLGLHVDVADEAETGADIEIWFLSAQCDRGVGFVIQAKRSHCGHSAKLLSPCDVDWKRHRFQELDHPAGERRPKGSQARDLTRAHERSGRSVYPLYAFYTPGHVFHKSGRIRGVMLADGHDVRRTMVLGRKEAWKNRTHPYGKKKSRRANAEYKTLEALSRFFFPLSDMFCLKPWTPIKQDASIEDYNQALMLLLRGNKLGVATIPEPDDVAQSVSKMIVRAREAQDSRGEFEHRLPFVTDQIPPDILQLASGGASDSELIRPDLSVAQRRIVCVATATISGDEPE
jgi:hypothetical protein